MKFRVLALASVMSLALVACDADKGGFEETGEDVDNALEELENEPQSPSDSVEDAIDDAGDAVEDAADEIEDHANP